MTDYDNNPDAIHSRIAELLHKRSHIRELNTAISAELKSLRVRAARLATNVPKKRRATVEELERAYRSNVMLPDMATDVPSECPEDDGYFAK